MRFFILTDIPVWVRPLVRALEARGADVHVSDRPEAIRAEDVVVNRCSTRVARKQPEHAAAMAQALRCWEKEGRLVVNGADCLGLGFSKWAQAEHLRRCGVATPETKRARPGQRGIPDQPVLLKPPAGGFGRGIRRLEAGEPLPGDLTDGWVEQVIIEPSDGAVHRVETLGGQALYEAISPITPDCFDYCLAHASPEVVLRKASDLSTATTQAVAEIMNRAGMELGSVEYLFDHAGQPWFIDLNPVSSLHSEAENVLGRDPMACLADYLCGRAESPPSFPLTHNLTLNPNLNPQLLDIFD